MSGEKEVAQYPFGSGNIKITCQSNQKEENLSDAHGRRGGAHSVVTNNMS